MKNLYVFINWQKQEVVTTFSNPGAPYVMSNPYVDNKIGPKALKLLEQGYVPIGYVYAHNLSCMTKFTNN